jgi:hypothetical protein
MVRYIIHKLIIILTCGVNKTIDSNYMTLKLQSSASKQLKLVEFSAGITSSSLILLIAYYKD